ncbi:MAG: NAD(P)H nitroreductase [Omnitrophica WOR_2 bacterium GWF2_43_52]|nr:MAG: NAD(P)H nitroreductase [Omnitrophica WOR_2 bacterium GWA2_44_7]OGX16616.1 MAG: NAD(P)H nitroreductase [Omnitrophica WOR_2 bacterium GWC2_44_8]OGX21445.1 MAG: NAD(P)H nitroreductase [Omnitrophica WOR_2 bacterium GWF2_43_52]HAH22071.1 NAD(P)H nitroreductase [Candidatus Omnitrophota bacterium]HBG62748.1 NAD(P)H nitroreductase [Candidatus Omnitrophota bacterium]
MSFLELVKARRSVRKYARKPIPREVIDKCLEAARLAPSACNSQPWYFIVVDDEKLKSELTDKAFAGIYSINSFAKKAPVIVAVVTERSKYIACVGGYIRGVGYSLIDIGIACEHFILQAQEEGLGTCWLGWFDEKQVKRILGIPKDKKVDVMISAGYPEGPPAREKTRKSLNEIRRFC